MHRWLLFRWLLFIWGDWTSQKWIFIFLTLNNSKTYCQTKTHFRETLCYLQDTMSRQWPPCFLVLLMLLVGTTPHSSHQVQHQCYLQDVMPCQLSSRDIPQVLRIWERFLLSGVFYLTFLPAVFKAFLGPAVQPQS